MEKYVFHQETCGTVLTIEVMDTKDPSVLIQDCFSYVLHFEQQYSRFIPGNWLDKANTMQETPIPLTDEAYTLLQFSLDLAAKTEGAFDPTIISALEACGYDHTYSFQKKAGGPMGYKHVELKDHEMTLHDGVKIEFGGVGKGYLLDIVSYVLLNAGLKKFIIDFGGDIIAYGGYTIGLENPFDLEQVIGTIVVDGFAVASSNGKKRAAGDFHHLLDAYTGEPVRDIAGVYISAANGLLADAYSTAVFVSGAEKGKKLLAMTDDIRGLIVFSNGTYRKKEGYAGEVFSGE